MKDLILSVKKKAMALDLDADFLTLENQLIELKKEIRILDKYLDLNLVD